MPVMPARMFVLALLCAVVLPVAAFGASSEYATLLASLKAGDTGIDYGRLRLSYMESTERKKAMDTSAAEKAMMTALNAKDFPDALKNAETVLESEYINMD